MKQETKKILDKQLKKDRHFLIYAIVAIILITNIVYIIYSPATTTIVTGMAIQISASNNDSVPSHNTMSVLLDSGETVLVDIPGPDFFKHHAKVELTKAVSVMGKTTYEFNDYKE
ncbi:MAG: hypothetical protein AB8B89_07410 [Gammaproteobacteria bacterium]